MANPNISRTNSLFSDFELLKYEDLHDIFKHESAGIGISSTMASNSSMYYPLIIHCSVPTQKLQTDCYLVKLLTGVLHLYNSVCWC